MRWNTNKFHAHRSIVDGVTFDSRKEGGRYAELKLLEKGKQIEQLILQPMYILQPKFDKGGIHYRAITYTADFYYYDKALERYIVEDSKGFETQMFKMKRKMFEYRYPELFLLVT
jgi:hypothetical protein